MQDQPSRVALLLAAARAYTSHEFDPSVRNPDWIADALLSPDEIALLDNHPMGRALGQDYRIAALDPDVSGLARPILVATRYIDERLREALLHGIRQVVILNGGFDTRSYRFRAQLEGVKVIEIDAAPTQRLKRARIEKVLGPPPPYLSYANELDRIAPNEPTFFIWEDASMRASEVRVRALLTQVATFAKGSSLVLDYVPREQVDRVNRDPVSPQSRWDKPWAEPWIFGVPRAGYFESLGFTSRDVLDTASAAATRRYLMRRDGTTFGPLPNTPGVGHEADLNRILVTLDV